MDLDSLAARERHALLLERYGPLLTAHQREVLELYFEKDWSLAEIATWQKTSRAAVHDLIRRATEALATYESRLRLVAGEERRQAATGELRREMADLGRRLGRLEARLGRIGS